MNRCQLCRLVSIFRSKIARQLLQSVLQQSCTMYVHLAALFSPVYTVRTYDLVCLRDLNQSVVVHMSHMISFSFVAAIVGSCASRSRSLLQFLKNAYIIFKCFQSLVHYPRAVLCFRSRNRILSTF